MYKIKTEYFYKPSETDIATAYYNTLIEEGACASLYASQLGVIITVEENVESRENEPQIDEWSGD